MKNISKKFRGTLLITFSAILFYVSLQNLQSFMDILKGAYSLLTPLIMGFCIAFILHPMVTFFEKYVFSFLQRIFKDAGKGAARGLSILLSLLVLASSITFLLLLILPEVRDAFTILGQTLPNTISTLIADVNKLLVELDVDFVLKSDGSATWLEVFTILQDQIVAAFENGILTDIASTAMTLLSAFFNILVGVIMAIYALAQWEYITYFFRRAVLATFSDKTANRLLYVGHLSSDAFHRFITGQLTEALILGGLCFFGMVVFGFPYPTATSCVVGVMALIPVFGAWIGGAVGVFLALSVSVTEALFFIVFMLVLQQLEGNFIYPKVVGKSVGLPGLLVFMAVILGAGLGGVTGMLCAVPLMSIVYTLVRESVAFKLQLKGISIPETPEIVIPPIDGDEISATVDEEISPQDVEKEKETSDE